MNLIKDRFKLFKKEIHTTKTINGIQKLTKKLSLLRC